MNRPILENRSLQFTKDGLSDFYWPVARREYIAFRDHVIEGLIACIRRSRRTNDQFSALPGAFLPQFVNEALSVFQVAAVQQRADSFGRFVDPPAKCRLHAAFAEDRIPEAPASLCQMVAGPPRRTGWKAPLGFLRDCFIRDPFSRPLVAVDMDADVVVTQSTPLTRRHAELEARRVVFAAKGQYFRSIDLPMDELGRRQDKDELATSVIDVVAQGYRLVDITLTSLQRDYLRSVFRGMYGSLQCHMERLLAEPAKLPRTLWTGSGSNVWDGLLRIATRQRGGEVTGHDHGNGAGFLSSGLKEISDLRDCDVFVTFTQGQVVGLKRAIEQRRLIDTMPQLVDIGSFRATAGELRPTNRCEKHHQVTPGKTKTIMYAVAEWFGETAIMHPPMVDVVAVDFQVRLLHSLVGWGFDVLFKPHPESVSPIPPQLAAIQGVSVADGRFEDMLVQADVLLFDWLLSTTIGHALKSDKPIVIVDFGLADLLQEAKAMLARRCAIVDGTLDERNRAIVDWTELHAAIDRAPTLQDDSFVREYLGTS